MKIYENNRQHCHSTSPTIQKKFSSHPHSASARLLYLLYIPSAMKPLSEKTIHSIGWDQIHYAGRNYIAAA